MKTNYIILWAILSLTFSTLCYGQNQVRAYTLPLPLDPPKSQLADFPSISIDSIIQTEAEDIVKEAMKETKKNMTAQAQPFDPFGTYTLMSIIDKNGNTIEKPFDQYKICMKDVSLTFVMEGDQFIIRKTDKNVLKYTGETPDAHDATATRIYDCDREHFTLKWWSTEPNHRIFPHNDWCIEHYALYNTSSNAGRVLRELNKVPNNTGFVDTYYFGKNAKKSFEKAMKNPILGRWKVLGTMDELRNVKQELQRLHEHPLQGTYSVVTLSEIIDLHGERGTIVPLELNGKKSFTSGNSEYKLTWLAKDIVAVEINLNNRIDYLIWERMDGNISIFQDIAKRYTKNQ